MSMRRTFVRTLGVSLLTMLFTIVLSTGLAVLAGSASAESRAGDAEPLAEDRAIDTTQTTADRVVEMTPLLPAIETMSPLDMRDDGYNSEYIFGMTKGVSNSTWVAGMKGLFFVFTIPLDIVLLPFTAIGGFF